MERYKKLFFILLITTTLLRLSVVGEIGLGDDEAHYFAWSRFLGLSYFDHPPMVAYLIAVFTKIGGINEFSIRIGSVIFFFFVSIFVFLLAKRIFNDDRVAFFSVLLLNITPVFTVVEGMLMLPDAPLGLFWVITLYLLYRAIKEEKALLWCLAGCMAGLGLLSKYNAIFLFPSTLLFLLFSKKNRFWLTRKEPYISLAIALLIFIPVIIWNIQNGWASFGFQLSRSYGSNFEFSPEWFAVGLVGQMAYISPFLFFASIYAIIVGGYRGIVKQDDKCLFLFSFSIVILLFFAGLSFFKKVLPHWPTLGFVTAFILLPKLTLELFEKKSTNFRKRLFVATYLTIITAFLLSLVVPVQALFKAIPLPAKIDRTTDLYAWPEAGERILEIYSKMSQQNKTFVFTHRPVLASHILFSTRNKFRVYCLNDYLDQYDFWSGPDGFLGGNAILLSDDRYNIDPRKVYKDIFSYIEAEPPMKIYIKGKHIRTFFIYKCYNYNPSNSKSIR
ncbi:MAG: glycosyltransferase family 39 protein [Pseudomonadota bacterium]